MKTRYFPIAAALAIFCLSTSAAAMDDDFLGNVDIHGFVSQGYLLSDEYNYLSHKSKDGSFEYSEVGINFGAQLSNKLGLGVQFFARDLGDVGNNKVALDWAYGDYRFQDWMGLRFGRIKVPSGLWNEIRDYDMLRPWIVLPQGLYNDLTRDATLAVNGIGFYGNIPAGAAGNFDYYVVTGNINPDPEQGSHKYFVDATGGFFEVIGDGEVTANGINLRWNTFLPGLMIGMYYTVIDSENSLYLSALDSEMGLNYESVSWRLMVEYTWESLSLWAEYNQDKTENEIVNLIKTEADPLNYYVGAAYRFTEWFQLGTYYTVSYADGDDKDGDDMVAMGRKDHKAWEKDFALTLRFDLNDYWVFKIEGHLVDGTKHVLGVDNPNSDFSESDWYYSAAKLSVSF